eukprot:evm.model.scf_1111.1 EVM.evm.TU.scf_1111.1   scf_1111:239-898(-)
MGMEELSMEWVMGSIAACIDTPPRSSNLSFLISAVYMDTYRRNGVCGNEICEVGESIESGSLLDACPLDCPALSNKSCPEGKAGQCSGRGICAAQTGDCICYKGFAGEDCAECDVGYEMFPNGNCGIRFDDIVEPIQEKWEGPILRGSDDSGSIEGGNAHG